MGIAGDRRRSSSSNLPSFGLSALLTPGGLPQSWPNQLHSLAKRQQGKIAQLRPLKLTMWKTIPPSNITSCRTSLGGHRDTADCLSPRRMGPVRPCLASIKRVSRRRRDSRAVHTNACVSSLSPPTSDHDPRRCASRQIIKRQPRIHVYRVQIH
ncbi:hypothetical protein B0I37DRAFT_377521 [Chaetomium sp. MPI-CAGE-AT-0009]|nr:hypothetical protein B0I37DRAFT_377521 [Chaetomium sp. MPI-CAGE-AT-0009]